MNRRSAVLRSRWIELESRVAPAILTVTNSQDAGPGSLRDTVAAAANGDEIRFDMTPGNVTSPIQLTGGQIAVTKSVTITGPGENVLTVSGDPTTATATNRVFWVENPGAVITVSMSGLTLTGGNVSAGNGGSLNVVSENIVLADMIFVGNMTAGNGGAVGVTGSASATFQGVRFEGNSAGTGGGGLALAKAAHQLIDLCVFVGNTAQGGGAVWATEFANGAGFTLSRSQLSGNVATNGNGGGLSVLAGRAVTLTASTFNDNKASGRGGGFYAYLMGATGFNSSPFAARQCTVSSNSASVGGGGAVYDYSGYNEMSIISSTLTANTATVAAGGFHYKQSLGYSGGASGTIFAGNHAPTHPDLFTESYQPFGISQTCLVGTDQATIDPMLLPLADNGGPTLTHMPLPLSPVIDKGFHNSEPFDQRGPGFPRVVSVKADVGAVESIYDRPLAASQFESVNQGGGTKYAFVVRYTDSGGTDTTSLGTGDIQIQGTHVNAKVIVPELIAVTGSGKLVEATYAFTPPGGQWDGLDTGTYTVMLMANEVHDLDPVPQYAVPATLGKFTVAIPWLAVVDEMSNVTDGDYSPGKLSLREAVELTNLLPLHDTIQFAPSVTGEFYPGFMDVKDSLTIQGPGADVLTLKGTQPFVIDDLNTNSISIAISGLTLSGGNLGSYWNGGAVFIANEFVTFTDMAFIDNKASSSSGGAIALTAAGGSLTVTNSVFTGNSAKWGGAISVTAGDKATIPVTLVNCKFENNTASASGGAIFVTSSATSAGNITLTDCDFVGNQAGEGGAIHTPDQLVANGCRFSGNAAKLGSGGGLDLPGGTATLTASTFDGNTAADGGGAIYSAGGKITVVQSTFSANHAAGPASGGGAVAVSSSATLGISNSTLTGNSTSGKGGAVYFTGASCWLSSTVVAGNVAPLAAGSDLFSTASASATNSLIGVTGTSPVTVTGTGNLTGTTAAPLDSKLGPLADNGGRLLTHRPLPGSPLVNAGLANDLQTDQRGPGYPRVLNGTAEIGAIEVLLNWPVVSGKFPDVLAAGAKSHEIAVTFSDAVGIDTTTLGSDDLVVRGGNLATPIPVEFLASTGSTGSVTATYRFTPPGGDWDFTDNGTYTVESVAGAVFDLDPVPNPIPALVAGTLKVFIPAVYVVDEATDLEDAETGPGKLSIREAIALANKTGTLDTITFDTSVTGVITLTKGQLVVTDGVTITGPGPDKLTLTTANPTVATSNNRLFSTSGPVGNSTVTITGLTLTGGKLANGWSGGAITSSGLLVLSDMNIFGNHAGYQGGAINSWQIHISDSTITANHAGYTGGGLYNNGWESKVVRCVFSYNVAISEGGAIFGGGLSKGVVDECQFLNNTASAGGAVSTFTNGTITVKGSRFLGNKAVNSFGGGIYLSTSITGEFVVENCTFEKNSAYKSGGGISLGGTNYVLGPVTIQSCTFSDNSSQTNSGGAIWLYQTKLTVRNSTITRNAVTPSIAPGGGIGRIGGTLTLSSSIIAANKTGGTTGFDVTGSVTATNSLIGIDDDSLTISGTGNLVGTPAAPLDPRLGPLADNGGPTPTHALLPASPAFNAGSANGLTTDQRGLPRVVNGLADIGALEVQSPPPTAKVTVEDGTSQRSFVRTFAVAFSEVPYFPDGLAAAFRLERTGPDGTLGPVQLATALTGSVVTLTVDDATFAPPGGGGSLIDGLYNLTIVGTKIFGVGGRFDGNANGTGGDDLVVATHRLFGDADGNKAVNFFDFLAFRTAFGSSAGQSTYRSAFDADGDGIINFNDFLTFRGRFGVIWP